MSNPRTFSGATLSFYVDIPAAQILNWHMYLFGPLSANNQYSASGDAAALGYDALDESLGFAQFCVDAIPMLKKEFTAVEKKTTCGTVNKKRKGSSMYGDMVFNFDAGDSSAGHDLLQAAFDDKLAVVTGCINFARRAGEAVGEKRWFLAQVAGYSETNGGDSGSIDLREVVLWVQADVVRVAAT